MAGAHRSDAARFTTAGLIALILGTLLVVAWAIFPSSEARANDGCPHTGDPQLAGAIRHDHPGASGSDTHDGVTVSWSGDTVTVSGGSAMFCVKAGPGTAFFVSFGPGAFTLTCPTFCNDQGQVQDISHISRYLQPTTTTTGTTTITQTTTTSSQTTTTGTTTTTQSTTSSTTTTSGTTTTGTTTSGTTTTSTSSPPPPPTTSTTTGPTVGPTTLGPTDEPTVNPTTVQVGGTAFTGPEDVVPLAAIALLLMTVGSGLLWAGNRLRSSEDEG